MLKLINGCRLSLSNPPSYRCTYLCYTQWRLLGGQMDKVTHWCQQVGKFLAVAGKNRLNAHFFYWKITFCLSLNFLVHLFLMNNTCTLQMLGFFYNARQIQHFDALAFLKMLSLVIQIEYIAVISK